jgi:hypothetical protein
MQALNHADNEHRMHRRWKAIAAGLAATLALSVGAAPAVAEKGPGKGEARSIAQQGANGKRKVAKRMLRRVALKAAAEYLELDREAFKAERRKGQSLAQIATTKGKTVEGLKAAISAAVDARLDKVVEEQRLTQEQASALLEKFQAKLDAFVRRVPKAKQ